MNLLRKTALLLLITIGSGALFAGCGSENRRSTASGSIAATTTGAPTAQPGIVAQLTGDPDDEVSAETQLLVAQAIALDENDEPLNF